MAEQRHTRRIGNSVLVALPERVRKHMGITAGQAVYWHLTRGKEAVLARSPVRRGGHPEGLGLQRELEQERALVERLKRRLGARDLKTLHEGENVGWMKAQRYYAKIDADLSVVLDRLNDLAARMPYRGSRARRAPRATPEPSPSLAPPSSDVSAGEAVTPGVQPPGDP